MRLFVVDPHPSSEQPLRAAFLIDLTFAVTRNIKYITRGGYMKVARIWADSNARPRPESAARAQARIDEILNQRLTIEDAEGFIQANVGKPNPYMGQIYLLLGELYERDGDVQSAKEIYGEIPDLFPNEPDLIARAKEQLTQLESK